VRCYRWSERVDNAVVELGVIWIAGAMYDGRKERIVLPVELHRRVLGMPPREA
jgi:hypothetical protein